MVESLRFGPDLAMGSLLNFSVVLQVSPLCDFQWPHM